MTNQYGSDTTILLQRLEACQTDHILRITGLNVTSLPPLPSDLKGLLCANSKLTVLPPLPPTLRVLNCAATPISVLPPLPNGLHTLYCDRTPLRKLPPLPDSLRTLNCEETQIKYLLSLPVSLEYLAIGHTAISSLPEPLPPNLVQIDCPNTRITVLPGNMDTVKYFNTRGTPLVLRISDKNFYEMRWAWKAYHAKRAATQETEAKKRCQERLKVIREDLMMTAWHPDRIQAILTAGGMSAVDNFMGVD